MGTQMWVVVVLVAIAMQLLVFNDQIGCMPTFLEGVVAQVTVCVCRSMVIERLVVGVPDTS